MGLLPDTWDGRSILGNGLAQLLWGKNIWEWASTVVMGGGYLGMG